ncbi:DUF4179 domain-containing protein [Hazenella sp. IB182353]|uniref:DUF4179 domain-containing protein n=1 Tax=Polycladospora coralii TaxID=2771432 RepID=UPI00174634B7|nr:DUF4179 domain-containing protein [Polycladospora coralii]MBS7530881.1 DUF4179 domain-containing protein [Polycladospora coralii]
MLKEEKHIKNLFRETVNVHPPDTLHQKVRTRILHDTHFYKEKRRKRIAMYIVSSVAAIILFLGGSFFSPTMAEVLQKLPFIGFIYEGFQSDIGLDKAKQLGLTQEYQKTVLSNDIEVTLTSAYYDGSNLSIAYTLYNHGPTNLERKSDQWDERSMLIGSHTKMTEFLFNDSNVRGGFDEKYKKKGPRQYEGNLYIYPMAFPKEDQFDVEVSVSEIRGVKGDWKLRIPVTKEKVKEKGMVQTFTPSFKKEAFGGEICIKSVNFSPTGIELITETTMKKGSGTLLFSILEVGADEGVAGGKKDIGNGQELTTSRSSFPPMKEIPDQITIKAYSPDDSSKEVTFKVPLKK